MALKARPETKQEITLKANWIQQYQEFIFIFEKQHTVKNQIPENGKPISEIPIFRLYHVPSRFTQVFSRN